MTAYEFSENCMWWPSGRCRPIMSTVLGIDELSARVPVSWFRAKDDLGWFSGFVFLSTPVGTIFFARHEGAPAGIGQFMVDWEVDVSAAQEFIVAQLKLVQSEIDWRLDPHLMKDSKESLSKAWVETKANLSLGCKVTGVYASFSNNGYLVDCGDQRFGLVEHVASSKSANESLVRFHTMGTREEFVVIGYSDAREKVLLQPSDSAVR